jgi:hypothetical protein
MNAELTQTEAQRLYDYHLGRRGFARDCRWSANRALAEGRLTHATKREWEARRDKQNERYKRHDGRVRYFRKILGSILTAKERS